MIKGTVLEKLHFYQRFKLLKFIGLGIYLYASAFSILFHLLHITLLKFFLWNQNLILICGFKLVFSYLNTHIVEIWPEKIKNVNSDLKKNNVILKPIKILLIPDRWHSIVFFWKFTVIFVSQFSCSEFSCLSLQHQKLLITKF